MKTLTMIACFLLVALLGVMTASLPNSGVAHASPEDEELLRGLVRGNVPHVQGDPSDVEKIHLLLESGINPNAPDGFGRTAVHYAAGAVQKHGHANGVLILLLQHGGECCMQDNQGDTPLHYIAAEGAHDTRATAARIRTLLDNGAAPDQANRKGYTPLHFSAKTDIFGVQEGHLTLLLKGGGNPDRVTGDGNTALHLAASAPVLLDQGHGHHPFSRDRLIGRSITTFADDAPVIRELLAAGANPNAVNADGMTPLLLVLAVNRKHNGESAVVAATKVLLSGGANPDATTPEGATPLHLVLEFPIKWSTEDQRLLEALLGARADPNRKSRRGDTPLHTAIRAERDKEVIETLLQAAANPCLRNDSEQKLPSELALVSGQSNIAALLELAGSGRDGCQTAEENRLDLDRTVRREVESCLNSLGYDTGSTDGLFDSRTSAAIREWQAAHAGEYGEVTGYLGSRNELDALLEGCRVVLTPMCRGASASGCWMEVANQPGCHLWNPFPKGNETSTWSGVCSGGMAQGEGTLRWVYSSGSEKIEGTMTDGKLHGHGILYNDDGSVWEGPVVNSVFQDLLQIR